MVNAIEQETLLIQLTEGREMAKQLQNHLDDVTSPETCEALVEKILSTYDKALAMLTWRAAIKVETASPQTGGMLLASPQPHSPISGSPLSEISNDLSKNEKCHKDVFKKRKISSKWSQQVRVCSKRQDGTSLDDGYSWRKYGQKDILGANHPRAYYRCTHRNSRGCLATKQVQRTDEDPSVFEVIYKGNHSCIQTTNSSSFIFSESTEISKPEKAKSRAGEDKQTPPQQMLQNLAQCLKVQTEVMETKEEIFPSFSFPFTGVECENQESHFFSDADMMDGCSPTTSESYYFSSPCHINSSDIGNMLLDSQYGITDLITTPTSVINAPFRDLDFSVDQVDFDPNFPLDPLHTSPDFHIYLHDNFDKNHVHLM